MGVRHGVLPAAVGVSAGVDLLWVSDLPVRPGTGTGTGTGIVAASAAAFGYVHIIYGQWLSVVLTALLGALLAQRFVRTRSLAVVWLEHAMYGLLAFTVGLGSYFYNG